MLGRLLAAKLDLMKIKGPAEWKICIFLFTFLYNFFASLSLSRSDFVPKLKTGVREG